MSMNGIGSSPAEPSISGASSEALSFRTNAGVPETIRMPPQVGACIAESTDIMNFESTQHVREMGSLSPDFWDEEELLESPPMTYDPDFGQDEVAFEDFEQDGVAFERVPSPTPSYVEVFGRNSCTCADCTALAKANPHYPPSIREEKWTLYRQWRVQQVQKWRALQRKEKLAEIQEEALRRERAMFVVGRALNLSDSEIEQWRAKSYEEWHNQKVKELYDRFPPIVKDD